MRLESGTLFLLSHHLPSPSHLAPPTTLPSWSPQPTPCHRVFLDSSFTIPHLVTAVCTFSLAVHTPFSNALHLIDNSRFFLAPFHTAATRSASLCSYSQQCPRLLCCVANRPLAQLAVHDHTTLIWGNPFAGQRSDWRIRPHFRFVFSIAAIEATSLSVRAPPSATPLAGPCYRRSTICGTAR